MSEARAWMALGMALVNLDARSLLANTSLPLGVQREVLEAINTKDKARLLSALGLPPGEKAAWETIVTNVIEDAERRRFKDAAKAFRHTLSAVGVMDDLQMMDVLEKKLAELRAASGKHS